MDAENALPRFGGSVDPEPSPEIVGQLSKLVLGTTMFAIVVAPFVPSALPYWMVLAGTLPFAFMYGAC